LYISKLLRDIVPREEVWEIVNDNRHIWEKGKVKFRRASLLPISWKPEYGKADMAAILVIQRVDGAVDPIQLCYIYKEGDREHPYHYHVVYVHGIHRLTQSTIKPNSPEASLPPRYKKHLKY